MEIIFDLCLFLCFILPLLFKGPSGICALSLPGISYKSSGKLPDSRCPVNIKGTILHLSCLSWAIYLERMQYISMHSRRRQVLKCGFGHASTASLLCSIYIRLENVHAGNHLPTFNSVYRVSLLPVIAKHCQPLNREVQDPPK
jgi:hypothetical protein